MYEYIESLKDGVSALALSPWQQGQVMDLLNEAYDMGFTVGSGNLSA